MINLIMILFYKLPKVASSRLSVLRKCYWSERCKELIIKKGVDCKGLVDNLSKILMRSSMKNMMKICKLLSEVEYRLSIGCSDAVQIGAIVSAFIFNKGESD